MELPKTQSPNPAPKPSVNLPMPQVVKDNLLKKFSEPKGKKNILLVIGAILVVLAGVTTGWLLSGKGKSQVTEGVTTGAKKTETEAGVKDELNFPDTAEGKLEEGGISGEGTYHLVREGGASQNVYLTSTVIDMGSFVGKKVKVWGQTLAARKAGWLMDVGKIKVID